MCPPHPEMAILAAFSGPYSHVQMFCFKESEGSAFNNSVFLSPGASETERIAMMLHRLAKVAAGVIVRCS